MRAARFYGTSEDTAHGEQFAWAERDSEILVRS